MSRAAVAAAALSAGAWLGCNAVFDIGAPVHETNDGGNADAGRQDSGAPTEICLDGLDNDGDGKIDCEDPDCLPDHICIASPEEGWTGPLYVQTVSYPAAGAPEPCPDGRAPAVYFAEPSPAECTECSCDWAGATCSAPQLSFYIHGSCDAFSDAVRAVSSNCTGHSAYDVGTAVQLTAPATLLTRGTCTPHGGALKNPAPWGKEVRVCAAQTGGGCAEGKVCVKQAPPLFEEAVCMSQGGDAACPARWAEPALQVFGAGTDHRACSSCACDLSNASCGGGKYTVSAGPSCAPGGGAASMVTVDTLNRCTNVSSLGTQGGLVVSYQAELGRPQGQTCGTSTPSGAVEPAGEGKICCRQVGP